MINDRSGIRIELGSGLYQEIRGRLRAGVDARQHVLRGLDRLLIVLGIHERIVLAFKIAGLLLRRLQGLGVLNRF